MTRSVRLSIAGVDFSVRTDAKPKYVRELAAVLEEKIQEAKASGKGMSTQVLVMMAALSITDDLLQLQTEHTELRRAIRERSQRILDTLEREAQA